MEWDITEEGCEGQRGGRSDLCWKGEHLMYTFEIQHPLSYPPQNPHVQMSRQTIDFQPKIIFLTVLWSVIRGY